MRPGGEPRVTDGVKSLRPGWRAAGRPGLPRGFHGRLRRLRSRENRVGYLSTRTAMHESWPAHSPWPVWTLSRRTCPDGESKRDRAAKFPSSAASPRPGRDARTGPRRSRRCGSDAARDHNGSRARYGSCPPRHGEGAAGATCPGPPRLDHDLSQRQTRDPARTTRAPASLTTLPRRPTSTDTPGPRS